jgi:hypothetical protein
MSKCFMTRSNLPAGKPFQHLAYLRWVKENFPGRKAKAGSHRIYLVGAGDDPVFAVHYKSRSGLNLCVRGLIPWTVVAPDTFRGPTFPSDWSCLAVRLQHWKAGSKRLASLASRSLDGNDFRLFTQLTALLAFTPPECP